MADWIPGGDFPSTIHLRLLRAAHVDDEAPEWDRLFKHHRAEALIVAADNLVERGLLTEDLQPTNAGREAWERWKPRLDPANQTHDGMALA